MNVNNYGVLEGRPTKEPVIFTNKDGSRKIMLNMAVKNNYKNKDGQRTSEFIPAEAFIAADKPNNGVFDHIHEGDLIGFAYSLRNNTYTNKDGETVYGIVIAIDTSTVDLKESKATTDARHAKKAAEKAANENTPAPAPAPEEPAQDAKKAKSTKKNSKKAAEQDEELPFNAEA